LTTLDLLFAFTFFLGLVWTGTVFVLGELGDPDTFGADHHDFQFNGDHTGAVGDHHPGTALAHPDAPTSDHPSPLKPFIIAPFLAGFGGFGLIASLVAHAGSILSTLFALVGGLLFGGLIYLFYARLLLASQGSSEARVEHLPGTPGKVITAIPARGLGEIAFTARGSRLTAPARSATGEAIPREAIVMIQEMQGHIALVRPTH
jgi:hypothetical protein